MIFSAAGAAIVDVAAGAFHTIAIGVTGNLYSWGRGDLGQLGHGNDLGHAFKMKQIESPMISGKNFISACCGKSGVD